LRENRKSKKEELWNQKLSMNPNQSSKFKQVIIGFILNPNQSSKFKQVIIGSF